MGVGFLRAELVQTSQVSWLALVALFGVAVVPPLGCEDPGTETAAVAPEAAMLAAVGPEVVWPTLDRMQAALTDLDDAVSAWEQADGDDAARARARDAFLAAMDVWQELEVMQVGPAGSSLTTTAGLDLRDEVYSWPTVNPCRVDQETVRAAFDEPAFFQDNLVNTYGLDALEHLLYAPADNVCPNQVDINAEGSWEDAGPDGISALRSAYGRAVVDEVARQVSALQAQWSEQGEDFGTLLSQPGTAGSPYATGQEATNAVFDALFYLETSTKDRKLADPLGLGDCSTACEALAEGMASDSSAVWVAGNLRGFRLLFTGGQGAGFDDLLRDLGHSDVADRVLTHTDEALALAEAPDAVIDEALYEAVKRVTDDLKGDLATAMALRIPAEAAGDND
ncbi:MAG: imelysin family protein [Myxococcales bacterium]|nr:imelysin family protein [Myxococcales bacterium]